jgi:peptide/nickel transport system substrate-binding protein
MGRIRLQVVIALLAILLLGTAMTYVAFNVTTVTVPDSGGAYIEGIAGNPNLINPILCQANPVDKDLVQLIFNGLTRPNDKGEILPDLAERWDISADGMAYTFYLRQGVTWHDGAPFTAADVVFTVNMIKHPGFQGVPFLSDMWRTIVVEQIDTYRVRLVLRAPFAPFLDYTTIGILPQHILGNVPPETLAAAKFNAAPVGTGPYKLGEVSARRIALVANPDYYGARPYIERLEFVFYPDEHSVVAARERGEIAGLARILPEYLPAVRKDEGLTLYSAPISGYTLVYLNLDKGIFQDRAVRQAMLWALDRQKLVDEVLGGQGIVIHSPILPNSWAYEPNVPQYRQDLRKARQLLEDAGWLDGDGDGVRERGTQRLEFILATNEGDPTRVRLTQAISSQLAEVGIKAVPQVVGWEELVGQMLKLGRYDAILSGWQDLPPDPDPYPYWHSSQAGEDGLNYANYINETADLLLQEARSGNDKQQRIELYRHFQDLFARDVPSLLLYQPISNYAVDASIKNVQVSPQFESSDRFRTLAQWYVATQRMLFTEAREKGLPTRPR